MKKIHFLLIMLCCVSVVNAQAPANDVCSGAITLPVNATCIPATYSTEGATDNNETGDCTNGTETAVWFKFVATQTSATVTVTGSAAFDAVIGARSACASITAPAGGGCTDNTLEGEAETMNLSGLTIGNTYYIQVYDYYGSVDAASTFDICVVSFACTTTGVPYTQNFDGATSPAIPACNSVINVNGGNTWYTSVSVPHSAPNELRLDYEEDGVTPANDWYFTQGVNLVTGTTYQLKFWLKNSNAADYTEKMEVKLGTAATVAGMTTATLYTNTNIDFNTWTEIIATFTVPSNAAYYLGFHGFSDADKAYLFIDDINVDVAPACVQPSGVVVTPGFNNASVAFSGTPGNFIVEYGAPGFTPGTGAAAGAGGTVILSTSSPVTIPGLTVASNYDVYVRRDCSGGGNGFSANSPVVSFKTTINCSLATVITGCGVNQVAAIPAGIGYYNSGDCYPTPGNEILYSFTPATTGQYIVNVSSINTTGYIDYLIKAASNGCGESGWECLADVNTGDEGDIVTLNLVGGTTYYFLLDAEDETEAPSQTFSIICPATAPVNDNAAGAITLTTNAGCSGVPYTNEGATQGATEKFASCAQSASTGTGGTIATHTVWFKFVATTTAVRVSTDIAGGTLEDTQMGLFSATNASDYSTFTILSCDDDNGVEDGDAGAVKSTLFATGLTVGQTYYVSVDGFFGETGTFCLTVDDINSGMLSTTATCVNGGQAPIGSQVTYTGQAALVDEAGKLIAIVRNPAGGSVNSYLAEHNINTGAVRDDGAGNFYLNRNYHIANATATNVQVQFFFTNAELAALTAADPTITLTTLGAFKQTGTVCNNNYDPLGGSGSALAQTAFGTQNGVSWIQVTTPSFSNFYLNKAAVVLPITVEYFRGTKQGTTNMLNWKVNTTSPSLNIILERSSDGITFSGIYSENAASQRCQQPFDYNDLNPVAGINHYRLKLTDPSGKVAYSAIVILLSKERGFELTGLSPNPVRGEAFLNISSANASRMEITITDIAGKTLAKQNVAVIAGTNRVPMNFTRLAAGTYQVTGKTADGEIKTIRFVKQ